MADKIKTFFALLFFGAALFVPLLGFGYGWWRWDIQIGLLIMVATFAIFFLVGVITLWQVRDMSWLTTSLPFLFGGLYTVLPDVIPFQVDDAAAATAGALFSYALALRNSAQTPKWVILPLLGAALYALLGGSLPGPFDEIIVDLVALLIAGVGTRQGAKKSKSKRRIQARGKEDRTNAFYLPKDERPPAPDTVPKDEPPVHVPPFIEEG